MLGFGGRDSGNEASTRVTTRFYTKKKKKSERFAVTINFPSWGRGRLQILSGYVERKPSRNQGTKMGYVQSRDDLKGNTQGTLASQ